MHNQPSLGSSLLPTSSRMGVRNISGPIFSSSWEASKATELALDRERQRSAKSSSPRHCNSLAVPTPVDTSQSISTVRFSAPVIPSNWPCVRQPRPRISDSTGRTTCSDFGGASSGSSDTASHNCILFSRRAASIVSVALDWLIFALLVDKFQLPSMVLLSLSSSWRPRIDGPPPGVNISQRKSEYVSSPLVDSARTFSMSKTSPSTPQTLSMSTLPEPFVSRRSKSRRS
mmetsp:Transcript_8313/g.23873  ORF Transcript_8313/g.23873 Transcript_8313/m.23873 type:complete len:230 (-) Transcript_8313:354-1043(-)